MREQGESLLWRQARKNRNEDRSFDKRTGVKAKSSRNEEGGPQAAREYRRTSGRRRSAFSPRGVCGLQRPPGPGRPAYKRVGWVREPLRQVPADCVESHQASDCGVVGLDGRNEWVISLIVSVPKWLRTQISHRYSLKTLTS